jgi:hypothetical protein
MIGVAASQGVYYYVYQTVVNFFVKLRQLKKASQLNTLENILVAAIAGVATVFATTPIWVINTRMSVAKKYAQQASQGFGVVTLTHVGNTQEKPNLYHRWHHQSQVRGTKVDLANRYGHHQPARYHWALGRPDPGVRTLVVF